MLEEELMERTRGYKLFEKWKDETSIHLTAHLRLAVLFHDLYRQLFVLGAKYHGSLWNA